MSHFPAFRISLVLFALLLVCGCRSRVEAADLGWQPNRTWVFAASAVAFKDKEMFDSFPVENRRDDQLVSFFRGRGVPDSHIVYLKDQQASLSAIQTSFQAMLRRAAPDDTLFFYYQGHGYRSEEPGQSSSFAAYDTDDDTVPGWPVNSITATIDENFRGKQAILCADCCYSGSLAESVRRHRGRVAYACFTSSSAREISTGHWTFSQCLLDALRGEGFVDANGDGVITAGELALHAHDDMAIAEEQHASFALSGGFARETVLAESQPKPRAPVGLRVKAKQDGTWYAARVVALKGGRWLVSYIGYDEDDEWFKAGDTSQLRLIQPAPTFPIGADVEVEWKGDWYRAKVLKVDGGVHFIHYVEDDSSWDEWVSSKRIRAPQ